MANVQDRGTGKTYQVVLDNTQGLVLKDADNITFALPRSSVAVTTGTTLSRVGS